MGRLSLKSRPQEVIDWGHQRDSVPLITDVRKFHDQWITWWGNCQPKWRSIATWPFPCDYTGNDWARLDVSGPHGLFAIVMSTSWWAASASLDPYRTAFDAAIADLRWVIERLLHINSQLTTAEPTLEAAPGNRFPGHGDRNPGKRKIKPSYKAHTT